MEGVEESGRKEQRKRETNMLELGGGYGGLRRVFWSARKGEGAKICGARRRGEASLIYIPRAKVEGPHQASV
jgi:hypothetical protein